MEKIIEVIGKMQEIINEYEFKIDSTYNPLSFSQAKKLTFATTINFVLSLIKTTLQFEIERYFDNLKEAKFAKSSVIDARSKIKFEAFKNLLIKQAEYISMEKTHKGYQIIAIDGMEGKLPRTPKLMAKYQNKPTDTYPTFHAVTAYDVLNRCFINATFDPFPTNERGQAIEIVKFSNSERKQIYLFDRGFPSIELIKTLNDNNKKFVMRCNKAFLKEVNEFRESEAVDKTIKINYTKKRAKDSATKLIESDIEFPIMFNLRCVKVILDNGEIELLLTNLPTENFVTDSMKELYFLRWGIETSFNYLKNAIKIEDFVSLKENLIKQEFYASLIVYNLSILLSDEANKIIVEETSKKN